ncbi:hypothetical protein [Staphylococcus massiliensis]|uniref:Asparagine synthetase domain-containing protein n=1 Tax=Staphylococcus massiliensis S46 TaxID=1229783 RepID=K9B1Z8_9STAP|nr:hypothetical protein [Staphylococcus massiliensis]EKU47785.1 hypothetical protein C273_07072 [Staphylococcus massiliensis S46]MCG3401549.1 hypothetical protein [Staphylococcus massiliensis]
MKKTLRLYPNGFLLLKDNQDLKSIPDTFKRLDLLNDYYFYFEGKGRVQYLVSETRFIIISGHHSYVGQNEINDTSELLNKLLDAFYVEHDTFLNMIDFLGGRYAIIIGDNEEVYVYQDASGVRTVYFTEEHDAIASHLHLLVDQFDLNRENDKQQLSNQTFTLNNSKYAKLKKLLPNHYLKFSNKSIHRFFPRTQNKYKEWSEDARFDLVKTLWEAQTEDYLNQYKKLILSLTGGNDSRVLLAMSKKFTDQIEYFTYTIKRNKNNSFFEKTAKLDEKLVKQITSDFNINHQFLVIDSDLKLKQDEHNVLDRNSARSHGRRLIPYYNQSFPETDLLHVRGNLLETGRAYYYDDKPRMETLINKVVFDLRKRDKSITRSFAQDLILNQLKDLGYDKSINGYDQRDLLYWEWRMGNWFSEVVNETDSAFETFLPYNLRAIIDISLSFPLEKRYSNYFFNELIQRNFPTLNFYGKNVDKNLYEQYIKDNPKKLENSIIKNFKVFNMDHKLVYNKASVKNQFYLPTQFLEKGNYAEATIRPLKQHGLMYIKLLSKYLSSNGVNYLKYEILKNDKPMLSEDIAHWDKPNHINIYNLTQKDIIKIRITALRNCKRISWQKASMITILEKKEIEDNRQFNKEISFTSPFSNY